MTYLSVAQGIAPCNYKMTVRTNAFAPSSFGNCHFFTVKFVSLRRVEFI